MLLHLGTVMLDEVLDDEVSWQEDVAAAGDEIGGVPAVPGADEDANVLVGDGLESRQLGYGTARCAAPTANCAAPPSVVDCVVKSVGACTVSAPILCIYLPIGEVLLAVGAVGAEASTLKDGDCSRHLV